MTPPPGSNANSLDLAVCFNFNRDSRELFVGRTALVDTIVATAFPSEFLSSVSVAAVGGYGRSELFPYSDIDLLILTTTESELSGAGEALAAFLSSLWDSGLRISHSTRTVNECCRFHPDNIELHISLLDLRYVAGHLATFQQLYDRLPETYRRHSPAIINRLLDITRQRHARFNNTPYHLEPNVKESPGGIRDIHLLRWLAQLQPGEPFLQEAMSGLKPGSLDAGSLNDTQDQSAQEWLFSLRCFLHLRAGRDANLLSFEMQDEAALLLPRQPMPPEEWMRLYYHHARRIYQRSLRALEFAGVNAGSLLVQFRNWKNKVETPDFSILRNRVYLRRPDQLFRSGSNLLSLFCFVGERGAPLSWDAHWTLQQGAAAILGALTLKPPDWSDWRSLLSQPYTGLALSEMQETSVLTAAIPQWGSIDSLVVRDFYHRYTVDEHTLLAICEIDHLARILPAGAGRFARLAKEDGPSPELRLALLLHDIGKGSRPGDHVRGSREAAREVMVAMSVPETNANVVLFLIRHHLDLSILMNGRDLEDPATARHLTAEINTVEHLRRLTLLTFADISAVNPTAMNPWRLEQLWRVYALGVKQLTRELASDRIHEPARGFQEGRSSLLLEFLDGFPKRYIRTHSRDQIERHLQLAMESRREGVAVEITREAGAYLMTVLAHDKSGLFAALCGALASFGMNIVKGEASSNSSKVILDLIRFTDPNRTLELNPEELDRLKSTVRDVVAGSIDVAFLLRKRRPLRRPTYVVPTVRIVEGASDEATLIDFVGEDRPGLLYDLATAISAAGCNIEVVMIDTEAHKAIDVFYVTYQGGKLDQALQERLQAGLITSAGVPT